jgi:hypothetical protein
MPEKTETPKTDPAPVDPRASLRNEKIRAGLTPEQADAVIAAQEAHDKEQKTKR